MNIVEVQLKQRYFPENKGPIRIAPKKCVRYKQTSPSGQVSQDDQYTKNLTFPQYSTR